MKRTLQICKALIVAGTLETVRRKELYIVLILMTLMVVGAYSFSFFGVNGLAMFVKDMAFSCVGLFSTIIAVITSVRQIPDEIQRRTIYPMLARPITRWQFMLAKFCAAWIASTLCFLTLTIFVVALLMIMRIPLGPVFFEYVILKCFAFSWLCGFTILLSIYLSPGAAATVSLLLSLGSGVFIRGYLLFVNAHMALKPVAVIVYALFPNYSLFDMTKKLVYDWPPIPLADILFLFIYALLIGQFWIWVGWLRFRNQPI